MLQGKRKQDEVSNLMSKLADNLKSNSLGPQRLAEILAQLKVHGRDPRNSDAIFSQTGISVLGEYSFGPYSQDATRDASRCVANALLQAPPLRQVYIDAGFASKAADKSKIDDVEEEFLMSRTLLLLTYETKVNWDEICTSQSLAESISNHLTRHGVRLRQKSRELNQIEAMALTETLKLLFNLLNALNNHRAFSSAINPLFTIIGEGDLAAKPLQPPISSAINVLANLDLFSPLPGNEASAVDILPPASRDIGCIDRLITVLGRSLLSYEPIELETLAIPLLTVLRKIYDTGSEQVKQSMQQRLLPSQENRDQPIGRSDDLPSRLLRLTTSSGLLKLSESISGLMYELSNKDANLYVRNVGYGFAAGYLVSHHIPVPDSAKNTSSRAAGLQNGIPVNPVTGQRLDKESQETGPAMTDEEKEREAERLFVLFERLKATGVVDVDNPVRRAMEEGKFDQRIEELSDSE